MEKYKINYLKTFGFDASDFIPCEMCQNKKCLKLRSKNGLKT